MNTTTTGTQQTRQTGYGQRQQYQQQAGGRQSWVNVYKRVSQRVMEFRKEHPLWTIQTEQVSVSKDLALFRATILDEQGRVVSTGHKLVTAQERPDNYVETAETGSVGRALHFLGYPPVDIEDIEEE